MLPCEIIHKTPGLRLSHRYEYGILFDNLMNCLQHCFSEKNSVPGKQVCRFSGAVRNLLTASDTRDFPDNIHVNNDQQLESLHDLMSQLEGKLQSLRSVVKNRTWFRKSKLT